MINPEPTRRTIRTLLVANRGEIARRILRTCRDLGIRGVALYSEADRALPYVREADRALCIGPPPPRESYLRMDSILDAAARACADAIHPGYGFLAENAEFAERVIAAGFAWVGPPPAAMRAMGDKAAARALASRHAVPTVPGYDGEDQSVETFAREAERIGYPVLIKASAGGGGRGMRRVERPEELADALASARREAEGAFANGRLLCERYVERPRHVEVQILADQHGRVVHLFERECSVQRRHQKILEESPSPAVDLELRRRLGEAAISLCRAVGYQSAGTVEFLVDEARNFYFLEMNTRLQVEHPVTEMVTGKDLVALQLAIAEGRPLPFAQEDVPIHGHAIEARVCAEDPSRDHLPSSGTLVRFDVPGGEGVRLDAGFETGDEVSVHYDSMLAKLIAHGPDRASANRRLERALRHAWAPGLPTNLPLLREIVAHPAWEQGELDTHFLARHGLPTAPPLNLERGAAAASIAAFVLRTDGPAWGPHVPPGYRQGGPSFSEDRWRSGAEEVTTRWRPSPKGGLDLAVADGPVRHVRILARSSERLHVEVDGEASAFRFAVRGARGSATHGTIDDGDVVYIHFGEGEAVVSLVPRHPRPEGATDDPGSCVAPMPGKVARVRVAPGAAVKKGEVLVVLEAMKMEHSLLAPEDGVVTAILVAEGETVTEGAILVRLEPKPDAEA